MLLTHDNTEGLADIFFPTDKHVEEDESWGGSDSATGSDLWRIAAEQGLLASSGHGFL